MLNRLKGIHPVFLVPDVVKAAEFYGDVLGFRFHRYWGEPPCFCIVFRDQVEIFLSQPEAAEANIRKNGAGGAWDIYIDVDNADALHAELLAKGVKVLRSPCDTVYQMREFEVEDSNGYRLCFAHDTSCRPGGGSESA